MATHHGRLWPTERQAPPVVAELQAIFKELPDEELLAKLRGPRRRGPKGYDPAILWHGFVALYYLGLPSVSDLVRVLHDNPYIAQACGIEFAPLGIPSQPTFSRFFAKLASRSFTYRARDVLWALTQRLNETLPDFSKYVAIDSTDIKAWSNGAKNHGASDRDAGWVVKTNTHGNKKFVWGFKVHILCDTTWELPIVIDVTAGNVHDSQRATPLLRQAKYATNHFFPRYVIADSAYSSDRIRNNIRRGYPFCQPVIDPHPRHTKAKVKRDWIPEWGLIYNRRTAIERVNGRLKGFRRLDSVRVRGLAKVRVHAMLSVMVLQAQALATGCRASVRKAA